MIQKTLVIETGNISADGLVKGDIVLLKDANPAVIGRVHSKENTESGVKLSFGIDDDTYNGAFDKVYHWDHIFTILCV